MRKDRFPFELGNQQRESPSKLVDSVVQNLEVAMAVGLLSRGEALPAEAELANQLEVSTVTLRHALTILRDRELIETRRGRGGGSYVKDSPDAIRIRVESQLKSMSLVKIRELGDLTGSLMGAAARLATQRALPEDIEELERLSEAFTSAADSSARRTADSRFHISMAMAAQSSQLTSLVIQSLGQVAPLLWAPGWPEFSEAGQEHEAILDAIRSGDSELAQRLAIAHCGRESELLANRYLALVSL